ncbi:MAG: winged helix-turn-helix domain-containing protein [Candidatus Diapherotrites archaeon]|nr:winged helix-turn-helix domain-containing protein [Candidatus Diapherotrites archaeon]
MISLQLAEQDIKIISSETRRKILKSLKKRRKTLSELSEELKIKPSSAKEHLDILAKNGFVETIDEGRKWKYFVLTKKAQSLFLDESKDIISITFIFSLSLILIFFSLYLLYTSFYMQSQREDKIFKASIAPKNLDNLEGDKEHNFLDILVESLSLEPSVMTEQQKQIRSVLAIILLIIGSLFLFLSYKKYKNKFSYIRR